MTDTQETATAGEKRDRPTEESTVTDENPPAKQQKTEEVNKDSEGKSEPAETNVQHEATEAKADEKDTSIEANGTSTVDAKESTDVKIKSETPEKPPAASEKPDESKNETEKAGSSDPRASTATDKSKQLQNDGNTAAAAITTPANALPPGLPTGAGMPVNTSVAASISNPDSIVEERGEVSALYVGRVIGKGGEMIRDLQARSACRIDVDQNVPPGQPRVITYRGTRKTVDFAKRLVQMLCVENATDADLPLGEAKREYLVVPAQSVGKIIGRGGEMIRELQSRSQAKIQVDHHGNSGLDHSEKQVTITGTELSVTKAREMVLFLVANPMMDAMQSINMLIEDKVHRGGVWGSGPPYMNLPNQGQSMQPHHSGGGGGGGGGYGYDQQQQYYGGSQGGSYGAPAPAPYGAAAPYAGAQPAYQQQAAQGGYGQYGGQAGVEMEIFYAAKNFMGRIIGQKGVTINDLQRRSTCDIQINQDVPPGQDCEISIRGSRQGIEMVKQMLREIIEIGPNHPYAGGNRGGDHGGYQQGGYQQQQQQQGHQGYGGYQQQQQQQQQASYGDSYGQQYNAATSFQRPAAGYQPQPQAQAYAHQGAQYGAHPAYGAAPAPPAAPVTEWKSATSPDGQVYYYNERTGETQWDKPIGMP